MHTVAVYGRYIELLDPLCCLSIWIKLNRMINYVKNMY